MGRQPLYPHKPTKKKCARCYHQLSPSAIEEGETLCPSCMAFESEASVRLRYPRRKSLMKEPRTRF